MRRPRKKPEKISWSGPADVVYRKFGEPAMRSITLRRKAPTPEWCAVQMQDGSRQARPRRPRPYHLIRNPADCWSATAAARIPENAGDTGQNHKPCTSRGLRRTRFMV